ncbi:unnamed protein product, partial [Ixodes persulcatus]
MATHTKGYTALVKKLPASVGCKADELTVLTSSTREPKTAVRRYACSNLGTRIQSAFGYPRISRPRRLDP